MWRDDDDDDDEEEEEEEEVEESWLLAYKLNVVLPCCRIRSRTVGLFMKTEEMKSRRIFAGTEASSSFRDKHLLPPTGYKSPTVWSGCSSMEELQEKGSGFSLRDRATVRGIYGY